MIIDIVILGSGGAIPTLTRNLPSVAVQCDGRVFLFDCGEGTQTQMVRAKLPLSKIERIYISHLHGDHVMGLPGLLMTMGQIPRERALYIHGPPGISEFVEGNRRFLGHQCPFPVIVTEHKGGRVSEDDTVFVDAVPVEHSCFTLAFAFQERERPGQFQIEEARRQGIPPGPLYGRLQSGESVTLRDGRVIEPGQVLGPTRRGRKIVYATDTRPCDQVVSLALEADVLIHDGMFSDDLRAQARQKHHSTVVQAARIARRAKVGSLVLTHISSRYMQDGPLAAEARKVFPATRVARDLMEFNVPMYK